jgi:hypothetical protein
MRTHLVKKVVCPAGEVLVNGTFDEPPHQDATSRLFPNVELRIPQGELFSVNLINGVDLSVERFLTVSANPDLSWPVLIDCAGADPANTQAAELEPLSSVPRDSRPPLRLLRAARKST